MLASLPPGEPLADALVALMGAAVALGGPPPRLGGLLFCRFLTLDRLRRDAVARGVDALLGRERALLVRLGRAVVVVCVALVAVGPIRVCQRALVVHPRPVGVH